MKGLRLTMKEKEKYKVIAKVYKGELSVKRATIILKLSEGRIGDFLKIYEELVPNFDYETREETRNFNENTPNRKLMIAAC
ncbi:MAG: hypothetical protein WC267_02085 [Bacilli bacterium]